MVYSGSERFGHRDATAPRTPHHADTAAAPASDRGKRRSCVWRPRDSPAPAEEAEEKEGQWVTVPVFQQPIGLEEIRKEVQTLRKRFRAYRERHWPKPEPLTLEGIKSLMR